jgi:hypothetical protein
MQINYYNKYLKYKKKYLLMKKIQGGSNNTKKRSLQKLFDEDYTHYDEFSEAQIFKKYDLKSTLESSQNIYEYFIEPEIKNKFVISSHGALLTNPYFNKIITVNNYS